MGSSNSKQPKPKYQMKDTIRFQEELRQHEEEERRKALEKYGILIPPAFGVTGTPSQKGIGPAISIQNRLLLIPPLSQSPIVSYLDYLHETDLSQCILKDHLSPGMWISSSTQQQKLPMVTNLLCSCQWIPSTTFQQRPPPQQPTSSFSIPRSQFFMERSFILSSLFEKQQNEQEQQLHNHHRQKVTIQLRADAAGADANDETQNPPQGGRDGNSSTTTAVSSTDPSLSISWNVVKGLTIFTNMNTSGHGWIGSHYDKTLTLFPKEEQAEENENDVVTERNIYEGLDTMNRDDVNIKIGTWIPWSIMNHLRPQSASSHSNNSNKYIHGYAAVNMLGATAAIHTAIPSSSFFKSSSNREILDDIKIRKYFSINMNDVNRPPFQITFEHDDHHHNMEKSYVSITQVFTFDRYQYNPIDQRAPKVRNTIAWTARFTSTSSTTNLKDVSTDELYLYDYNHNNAATANDDHHDPSSAPSGLRHRCNEMSLGMAWQVNRSVAFKSVLYPQQNSLTTAMILKRWKHPRVTCSFMKNWNLTNDDNYNALSSSSLFNGWGIGIELETGDNYCQNPESYYYNYHPNARQQHFISNDQEQQEEGFPQTKATLPTDIEFDIQRRFTSAVASRPQPPNASSKQ